MAAVAITGTGLFTPPYAISNQELVESFNAWAESWDRKYQDDVEVGRVEARATSSAAFIEEASGIKSRKVMDRDGILDPAIMVPRLRARSNDEPSILCEMSLAAAREALATAARDPGEVDCLLVACSNPERPYPAIAIEVQDALGAKGFGYDLNAACSSATFGIRAAADALRSGSASCALVVDPEICTGHLNFRDRAALPAGRARARAERAAATLAAPGEPGDEPADQQTRARARRQRQGGAILEEWANTSSAGSIIAFHLHRQDLSPGDLGVICSFGAGYSVGSVVVRKL